MKILITKKTTVQGSDVYSENETPDPELVEFTINFAVEVPSGKQANFGLMSVTKEAFEGVEVGKRYELSLAPMV